MAIGRDINHFVIHGRSKERSDAAQTRGSMPRLPGRPLRCRILLRCTPQPRSRNGSYGLRRVASLLAPP
ncbi:hypothetical protein FJ977_10035 [Mesorhizobium sp. B2-1-3A]|nr:hypothetical protein FJ977_10035 [Mesorhizobium sp. B2-1-3A]